MMIYPALFKCATKGNHLVIRFTDETHGEVAESGWDCFTVGRLVDNENHNQVVNGKPWWTRVADEGCWLDEFGLMHKL